MTDSNPANAAIKNNPAIIAYLLVVFATPLNTNNGWGILYAFACFLLFIIYVFFHTKKYSFSLFGLLKRYHPVAYYLLLAFGISSLISYLLVLLGDTTFQQKAYSTVRYVVNLLIFFYVFSLSRFCLVNKLGQGKIFFTLMLGTIALVVVLLSIYHFAGAPNANGWAIDPPFGVHVRLMAMMASVSMMACLVFLLMGNNNALPFRGFLYLCLIICSAFLVWTGSRTSMVVTLLSMLILLVLSRIYLKTSLRQILPILVSLLLSVWIAEKFSIFEWSGLNRVARVSAIAELPVSAEKGQAIAADNGLVKLADKLTSGRMTIWTVSVNAVKKKPVFGLGPYGYFFIPDRPRIYDQPHNFILQFLVEWGVLGASLLLGLLAYFAWIGIRNIPQAFRLRDVDYVISGSVVFVLTLTGLTDGTYFVAAPLFFLATAFAVFPFLTKTQKEYFEANISSGP